MGWLGPGVSDYPLCFPVVFVKYVVYSLGAALAFGEYSFIMEEGVGGIGDEFCRLEKVFINSDHGDDLDGEWRCSTRMEATF